MMSLNKWSGLAAIGFGLLISSFALAESSVGKGDMKDIIYMKSPDGTRPGYIVNGDCKFKQTPDFVVNQTCGREGVRDMCVGIVTCDLAITTLIAPPGTKDEKGNVLPQMAKLEPGKKYQTRDGKTITGPAQSIPVGPADLAAVCGATYCGFGNYAKKDAPLDAKGCVTDNRFMKVAQHKQIEGAITDKKVNLGTAEAK